MTLQMTWPETRPLPETESESWLRPYYAHAPGVLRLGLIASADGRAAGPDGSSRSLNGHADLRILRTLRSQADVILVGARTARLEHYGDIRLRPALASARADAGMTAMPDLALVTYGGQIPAGLTPARTWILTTADSPAASLPAYTAAESPWVDRVLVAGTDRLDPAAAVAALAARGLTRVLCEGGPELARLLLAHDLVDDYCLTRSPATGGDAAPTVPPVPEDWRLAHRLAGGDFTMERWARSV